MIGNKGIARILARADDGQVQAFGELDRDVLHGMHGDIRLSVEHAGLQFFDKQALAAHLGQGRVQDFVALGGHFDQLDIQLRMACLQFSGYILRLPEGKLTFAGCDAQGIF